MNLFRIAWRSIEHRRLSSILTGFSMALGVALVVAVLVILNTVDSTFRKNAEGFHLIVGARGGAMELVLNTIYHLRKPVENVPYDFYLEFTKNAAGVDPDALFRRLDTNGDGAISYEAEILNDESKSLVRLLCQRADKTRDDKITPLELARVFSRMPFARVRIDGKKVDAAALFKQLDTNGDGALSGEWKLPKSLKDGFRKLRVNPSMVYSFFQRADRSGDGAITATEWQRALAPYPKLKLDADALFKQLDADADGKLTDERVLPAELSEAFDEPILTKEQAQSFLKDVDAAGNGDGFVSREELKSLLEREPYSHTRVEPGDVLGKGKQAKGKVAVSSELPESVRNRFGFEVVHRDDARVFFTVADQQPDGSIDLQELTLAINSPGKHGERVDVAIPYCLGDSYVHDSGRYRVVGTTPQMFQVEYADGKKYGFAKGQNLDDDYLNPKNFFQAVIGSVVAHKAGLTVGSTFRPTHGISGPGRTHDQFKVVGVLKPTGTPNDRALFVNLEGFYVLDGHSRDNKNRIHVDKDGTVRTERLPIEQREVTAILLRLKDGDGLIADQTSRDLEYEINKGQVAQAVFPTREVRELFDKLVGRLQQILLVLAILILVVASVGIMVAIYNSMNERVRDIAIMRALGAGRMTVMMVVLTESSLLAFLGGLCGFVLAHGLIGGVIGPWYIEPETGVSLHFLQFVEYELLLIPGLVLLSALAGFLPALAAYRTDVGKALTAAP